VTEQPLDDSGSSGPGSDDSLDLDH
jgi:hypothetical protein